MRIMRPTPVCTILLGALLLSGLAGSAGAQLSVTQTAGCPAPAVTAVPGRGDSETTATRDSASRASVANGAPDAVLLVAFSADELRFNTQPNARIRFCWGGDSLHIVERRNLPSPVVAGTIYRNVFIAAELRAYLNAECLSQRLGLTASSTDKPGNSACAALGLNTSSALAPPKSARDTTSVSREPR